MNLKKIAKTIRILSTAPIIAFVLINVLHFTNTNNPSFFSYFIGVFSLALLPLIAYPMQWKFKIIKGEKRASERKLVIIFSIVGYILGFVYSLVFKTSSLEKIVYLTYFSSVILIALFTFTFKINASGHMCGVSGPISVIVYVFGPIYLLLFLLLIIVIWASLYLERHNGKELILGSFIPIIALYISIKIFI